ncbi:DUF397 domain-containing protein [Streptomyces coelicoflavus]|uniref:DUF397 domain-containing protein n=1 Tax=Streptomyces coelicoflavus TaxID=285562 RepID=UPI001EF3B0B7|nr:DUF397 domain-containing protein [Streptomyces coelicoflavus]
MHSIQWQKSTYCGEGDSCVHVTAPPGAVHLTESSDPTGSILTVSHPHRLRHPAHRAEVGRPAAGHGGHRRHIPGRRRPRARGGVRPLRRLAGAVGPGVGGPGPKVGPETGPQAEASPRPPA